MRIKDSIRPAGSIIITKLDANDNILEVWKIENTVTTRGKERCASNLAVANPGNSWFSHLALGTNTDEESTEDLSLGDEFYRVELDEVYAAGATIFGHVVIEANDIEVDVEQVIYELGLLDAAVGGNLICRHTENLTTGVSWIGTEKIDVLWGVVVE